MVTNGDVILVQPVPRKQAPPPIDAPVEEVLPTEPPPLMESPTAEEEGPGYTPAPPGYAFEFGTGRVVLIRPDISPGAAAAARFRRQN